MQEAARSRKHASTDNVWGNEPSWKETPGKKETSCAVSMCGLILAGGRNTRMGGKLKPALPFFGITALERIARAMARHCRHIYVAVAAHTPVSLLRTEEVEQHIGVPLIVVVDQLADMGPLGGIVTALRHESLRTERSESVWLSAGDMPFASSAAASQMLASLRQGTDAVVPDVGGYRQPLQAVYRTGALHQAAENCAAREYRSMTQLLSLLRVTYLTDAFWESVGMTTRFVHNVNTPEQYEQAIRTGEDGDRAD